MPTTLSPSLLSPLSSPKPTPPQTLPTTNHPPKPRKPRPKAQISIYPTHIQKQSTRIRGGLRRDFLSLLDTGIGSGGAWLGEMGLGGEDSQDKVDEDIILYESIRGE
jgi:hypothetical protein